MTTSRILLVCFLVIAAMLANSAQTLAYTFTVQNQTDKPIYAQFWFTSGVREDGPFWFNDKAPIDVGHSSTLRYDGVRCMEQLSVRYNGTWYRDMNPGCGNKTFTISLPEGVVIKH